MVERSLKKGCSLYRMARWPLGEVKIGAGHLRGVRECVYLGIDNFRQWKNKLKAVA